MKTVWLVYSRKPNETMPYMVAVWLTKKLAFDAIVKTANNVIQTTARLQSGEGEWTDVEVVIHPNDDKVEVRGKWWGGKSWRTVHVFSMQEQEVHGDVVSALAAVSE